MRERTSQWTATNSGQGQGQGRWASSVPILHTLRRRGGIKRSEVARELGLSTSTATEVSLRMRRAQLISEGQSEPQGRGRPSPIILPHPAGPLVGIVELTITGWRALVADVTAQLRPVFSAPLPARSDEFLSDAHDLVGRLRAEHGQRLVALVISVPATVRAGRYAEPFSLGWDHIDFGPVLDSVADLRVIVENNATLAGIIEAERLHSELPGARSVLYLEIGENMGGSLIVDGRTMLGATGSSGEFGHMPLGDDTTSCKCGSRGCWGTSVSGYGLAARLGDPEPDNPTAYFADLLARTQSIRQREHRAAVTIGGVEEDLEELRSVRNRQEAKVVRDAAWRLGRGVAALVNALAPDALVFGGLAAPLHGAHEDAFSLSFETHLMTARQFELPAVEYARCGRDAAALGAALLALDLALDEAGLAAWEAAHS